MTYIFLAGPTFPRRGKKVKYTFRNNSFLICILSTNTSGLIKDKINTVDRETMWVRGRKVGFQKCKGSQRKRKNSQWARGSHERFK